MPLRSPNLDDRSFDDLLELARQVIRTSCPEWTDLSAGDPGIVLLEVFAHLTETMIYRLNRVPEKAYIEFLKLMGVRLQPPSAASVTLVFTATRPAEQPIEIPRGTRVTIARSEPGGEPVVFTTSQAAVIKAGESEASVPALHCEIVQGELAGKGTGQPGLRVTAARPPIIQTVDDDLNLIVGIEALEGELDMRALAISYGGKDYRIWRRVESFTDAGADGLAYVADLLTGEIAFGPAAQMRNADGTLDTTRALAAAPPAGREIRLWYRRGGGPAGNVAANTLKIVKDPIAGVLVTNPEPAAGGRAAETLENALIRGPQEIRAPWRAVTARDFEILARSSGAVARAKAFTQAMLWKHAAPGTVEVLLVPDVPAADRPGGRVAVAQLLDRETPEALAQIQQTVDERRPLGTNCSVGWAKYKTVRVQARVVTREEEDGGAVRDKVLQRLHNFINPLPTAVQPDGWAFGKALRVSNVYDAALSQAGVSYVDQVQLLVDEVPESDVASIRADAFQPNTWYAGTGTKLFRSVDNADGWEVVGRFNRGVVTSIAVHPGVPGLLAVATQMQGDPGGAGLYLSRDCGETWFGERVVAFDIEDIAWILRNGTPVLLVAASAGLYELSLEKDATPVQTQVFPGDQERGFYSVAVATDMRGAALFVAVVAQASGGVYLSREGGKAGSFHEIGLKGKDIRVLETQREGLRVFLWAGAAALSPGDNGPGCFSWELLAEGPPPEGWLTFAKQWAGGSCKSLAFQGPAVLAGTHHGGVLRLPARRDDAAWAKPEIGSGLPLREADQIFQPVEAVAVSTAADLLLAGGPKGVFRAALTDNAGAVEYNNASSKIFVDKVTLPPTWLFCSGEHYITVVTENEI